MDPQFCAEIMGQIVENLGALTCQEDAAAEAADNIRKLGSVAQFIFLGAILKDAPQGASSLFTRIPTSGRKFNQLGQRGWSADSVNDLVNNPFTTRAAINRANGNPATAFIRADGHYVVRDNVTADVVQMSDTRVTIGMGEGQWRPDSSIVDPFIPGQ